LSRELKNRTIEFAIACGELCSKLPINRRYDAYCRQLIRCSASVGANYRAALRAKSDRDFLNKLKIVEEEVDESQFWLELLERIGEKEIHGIKILQKEASELTAIFVASIRKVRSKIKETKNGPGTK